MRLESAQQVVLEIPNAIEVYRGQLILVDRQKCQLTVRLSNLPPKLSPGETVFVVLPLGETAHRVISTVGSRSDTLLQLRLVSRFGCHERRRAKRYPIRLTASVRFDGSDWLEAQVVDINAYGVGLRLKQPIHEGKHARLVVHLMRDDAPMAMTFESCYAIHERDGWWRVGGRFVDISRVDYLWLKRLFP